MHLFIFRFITNVVIVVVVAVVIVTIIMEGSIIRHIISDHIRGLGGSVINNMST